MSERHGRALRVAATGMSRLAQRPPKHGHLHVALLLSCAVSLLAATAHAQNPATPTPAVDRQALNQLLGTLPRAAAPALDDARAIWLVSLPLGCMDRVHPRPTVRPYFWVATARLVDNHENTRAFWGCTDWASSVSSTWATVRMLKVNPQLGMDQLARERLHELAVEKLTSHLGRTNFEGELAFFQQAGQYQRPYGYAWLLKLQGELLTWPDSAAKQWAANAAPLAQWMAERLTLYLAQLERPVRTGGQTNTALILSLALDYATAANDAGLRAALRSSAEKFYGAERNCDTQAEAAASGGRRGGGAPNAARGGGAGDAGRAGAAGQPARGGGGGGGQGGGGADVVSPCLAIASLMARIVAPNDYVTWLNGFLPPLQTDRFAALRAAADTAGTGAQAAAAAAAGGGGGGGRGGAGPPPTGVARLAGLSLQRAEALARIARALPAGDARVPVLQRLAAIHATRGLELARNDASGAHWVPAFAVLYYQAQSGAN